MRKPRATVSASLANLIGQCVPAIAAAWHRPVYLLATEHNLLISINPRAADAAPADFVGQFNAQAKAADVTDALLEHLGD